MNPNDRVFVAGHRGMVGSAIVRRLQDEGFSDIVVQTRAELDMSDSLAVLRFFEQIRPTHVFLAAARVGGILANDEYPVEFLRDNLAIQLAVIEAAHQTRVRKLLFLGSSCVYPKLAPQPMSEDALLTGPLEPTNQWYAVAKIAGIKLCQAYQRQYGDEFIAVMPTNLYGPHDNFDLRTSHVLPALIRKFHEAKLQGAPEVVLWGSGTPRREFMHVDDLADACVFVMRSYRGTEPINIGVGEDLQIRELAELVRRIIGYTGAIRWDATMPDGTPRKLLDVSRLSELGWSAGIPLEQGIRSTYAWFVEHCAQQLRTEVPASPLPH